MRHVASTMRWIGRGTSVLSLGFLLMFLGPEDTPTAGVTPGQVVGFLFFPFGVAVGLVLAWWREGLGGAIAGASLAGFYLVYGLLLSDRIPQGPWFAVFTAPALLFLGAWFLSSLERCARCESFFG